MLSRIVVVVMVVMLCAGAGLGEAGSTLVDGRSVIETPYTSMEQYVQGQLKVAFGCSTKLEGKWYENGKVQSWSGYCQDMMNDIPHSPWHYRGAAINQESGPMEYQLEQTVPFQGPVTYTLVAENGMELLNQPPKGSYVNGYDDDKATQSVGGATTVSISETAKQTNTFAAGVSMTIELTPPAIPEGSISITSSYDWTAGESNSDTKTVEAATNSYVTADYSREACAYMYTGSNFTADTYNWETHVIFNGFYGRTYNDDQYGMWYQMDVSPDTALVATLTGTVTGVPVALGETSLREFNIGDTGCNYTDPLTWDELDFNS